jgi:hypothetical protein
MEAVYLRHVSIDREFCYCGVFCCRKALGVIFDSECGRMLVMFLQNLESGRGSGLIEF